MSIIETILLGIASSIIASFVFWLLTFKISAVRIKFSDSIEKTNGRYVIRIKNTGYRDLTELNIIAKINIKHERSSSFTYLSVGNGGFAPVLWKNSKRTLALSVFLSQPAIKEFKKSFYSERIQEKADTAVLTLEDVLNEYNDLFEISFFVFGNDSVTGARKMFESSKYTAKHIFINEIKNDVENDNDDEVQEI